MDWVKAIKKLDDRKSYMEQSKKAKARAVSLDPRKDLDRLESFIIKAKQTYR
jgi:hypothetical protein